RAAAVRLLPLCRLASHSAREQGEPSARVCHGSGVNRAAVSTAAGSVLSWASRGWSAACARASAFSIRFSLATAERIDPCLQRLDPFVQVRVVQPLQLGLVLEDGEGGLVVAYLHQEREQPAALQQVAGEQVVR